MYASTKLIGMFSAVAKSVSSTDSLRARDLLVVMLVFSIYSGVLLLIVCFHIGECAEIVVLCSVLTVVRITQKVEPCVNTEANKPKEAFITFSPRASRERFTRILATKEHGVE